MGQIIKTVAGVGSVIPGPWQPWAAGAGALLGGLEGAGAAGSAERSGNALTQAQIEAIRRSLGPMLQNAESTYQGALQYDPHADTERGLQAFDEAANASATRDYGNSTLPLSIRGLTGGSEMNGTINNVAAARSGARGQYASELTMGERGRKTAVMNNAQDQFAKVAQLSSAYAGPASVRFGQAAGFDPSAYLNAAGGALGKIKWPWMKTKPGGGDRDPGSSGTGGMG
jgi:hypothetical protein